MTDNITPDQRALLERQKPKPVFHSMSVCHGCGCSGEAFDSVNVEAFELTGELYCKECAEALEEAAREGQR